MEQTIGIGLAGLGTVGAGVYRHLAANADLLFRRSGVRFEVRRVAVKDPAKSRDVELAGGILTGRWQDLLEDPGVLIVVELMGGIEEAMQLVAGALERRKPVVTGNKALLAEKGAEIFRLAGQSGTPVYFEAAVAGGIPIIKAVKEAFVANRFVSIHGILNGTSNYILTRMESAGLDYPEALEEARALGYAEADPTLDVSGWDAAHKAIILASLAYGFWVPPSNVRVEGIDVITAGDVRFADELGYRIKLLATIKASADLRIEVRVCPTLVPKTHVLASVSGVYNAVALRGDIVGETLFYGRGAGQDPTSGSVLADLVEAAQALARPPASVGFTGHELYGDCLPPDEAVSKFYLRLLVEDSPGVLARIAGILGDAGIGILSVIQPPHEEGAGPVPLILMIHDARAGAMGTATNEIGRLACVKAAPVLLHMEDFR